MNEQNNATVEIIDISTIQSSKITEENCPLPEEIQGLLNCFSNKWTFQDYSDEDFRSILKEVKEKLSRLINKWNKNIKINLAESNKKISELYNEIQGKDIDIKFVLFCPNVSVSPKNIDLVEKQHKIVLLFYLRDIYHAINLYINDLENLNVLSDIFAKYKIFYLLKLMYDISLQMVEFFSWCYMVRKKKQCIVRAFMLRKQHTHDLFFSTLRNLYEPPLYEPRDIIPTNLFNYRLMMEEILKDALKIKQVIINNKQYNLQLSELIELIKDLQENNQINISSFNIDDLRCLGDFTNVFIHQASFHFYWQIFYARVIFNQIFANNYYKVFDIRMSLDEYKDYLRKFFAKKFHGQVTIIINFNP